MTDNYSLSDIAAVTGNGANGNNGMWGNDAWQFLPLYKVTYIEKLRY